MLYLLRRPDCNYKELCPHFQHSACSVLLSFRNHIDHDKWSTHSV